MWIQAATKRMVGRRGSVRRTLRAGSFVVMSAVLAGTIGCGGKDASGAKTKLPESTRSLTIQHEACEESGHKVEAIDVNNDGKPDIRRIFDGSREICRISDLNRDGKPELFEYYDANGQLRRREAGYDDNGVVNAIEIYENGKLVRAELDTTNQGRVDTWDTFDPATGKRVKRERDSTGNGRVDQWWTYDGEKVTIAMDKNGDGLPDPETSITLGAGGAPIPSGVADGGAQPPLVTAPDPAPSSSSVSSELSPTPLVDAGAPKRGGAKR